MQKLHTYFDKKKFSFYTLFYSEHSGMLIKKKHKFLNTILKYSGFIVVFSIMGILFLLSSCKEEQALKPIKDGATSVIEVYKRDTYNLKSFIFKQQKLFN